MLVTRIKTAVVLFVLIFLVLFVLPGWTWIVFASLLAGLGFWEWLRLTPAPCIAHRAHCFGLAVRQCAGRFGAGGPGIHDGLADRH